MSLGHLPPATRLARIAVEALIAAGIRHVVLAPGSRSAPLAYALHDAERAGALRLDVRIDERDAGFLALGIARGLRARGRGGMAAVVTTSGTAVANLHPAVLEASYSRLPLLVLSADRPAELRGTGSNQTMRAQGGLFGTELRAAAELPAPPAVANGTELRIDPGDLDAGWREGIMACAATALAQAGPVQVNAAFRPPLVPPGGDRWVPRGDGLPASRPSDDAGGWLAAPSAASPSAHGDATSVDAALAGLGLRPVVVVGETGGSPADRGALERLARLVTAQSWPLLAEPSSGLRSHPLARPGYLDLLRSPDGPADRISGVLAIGHPTLSRPITHLLARDDLPQLVVTPDAAWYGRGVPGARTIAPAELPEAVTAPASDPSWAAAWAPSADDAMAVQHPAMADAVPSESVLSAVSALRAITARPGLLFAGSSSAIRDLDTVLTPQSPAEVHASRGLAGIDGLISTAAGLSIGADAPVRAVIGDVSALHDLGGLVLPSLERRPELEVIVLHDDGGSIFGDLEQGAAGLAEHFDRLFGTPHGRDFSPIAAGLGWDARAVTNLAELGAALAEGIVPGRLLEVRLP